MTRGAGPSYQFGPFRLDVSEHTLRRDGNAVPLTPKVFEVLRVLVENAGHLVTKDRLLTEVWAGAFVEEGNLNRAVSILRKALGETSLQPTYIETVPTRGYRFVGPVSRAVDGVTGTTMTSGRRYRWTLAAGTAALALLAIGIPHGMLDRPDPPPLAPSAKPPVYRQTTFTGKAGSPTLSGDGRRIAYVSSDAAERTVMVQELAGGRPLPVFSAPEVARPRWSPGGSHLMIWTRGAGRDGIYVMPQLGGTLRRIAADHYVACWSPDGSKVAVGHYLTGRISLLDAGGTFERSMSLEGARSIWDIEWSAANNQLLVVSDDSQGRFSLWTVAPDGARQTRILTDSAEITSARWAADANAIYYLRRAAQTASLNKLMWQPASATWGAVAAPVLTGLEADGSIALSADGSNMVYGRASYHSNLWMVDAARSNGATESTTKALTTGTALMERPRVSPDGNWLAFNIGNQTTADIYVMPITGGTPRQLTFLNALSVGPSWAPDGKRIAFASTADGRPRVWVVPAAGGSARPVSAGELSGDGLEVAWSPGPHILYQQTGNRNFYDLDPETREERLLVPDGSVGWMFSPMYSPDRMKIAVAWNRRPQRGIWVIDVADNRASLLSGATPPPVLIGWAPDGRSIYALENDKPIYRGVVATRGETAAEARIVRRSVRDGAVLSTFRLPFGEVGGVAMTPDGRGFVCTVYSSQSDVWIVENFDGVSRPVQTSRASL
jgi:Tol biopolymer transport system component/DNA-binding winged helix-turn-helix (wHTH) protein